METTVEPVLFENVTQYDFPALLALARVAGKTIRRKPFLIRRIFLMTVGTVSFLSALFLLLIFDQLDLQNRIIAVAALVVGLLALAEGIFFPWFVARSSSRLLAKGQREHHFRFTEGELQAETPGVQRSTYPATAFLAAYETEGYYVLMLDQRQGLVLDKRGFTSGSGENFGEFLERWLQKKIPCIK